MISENIGLCVVHEAFIYIHVTYAVMVMNKLESYMSWMIFSHIMGERNQIQNMYVAFLFVQVKRESQ